MGRIKATDNQLRLLHKQGHSIGAVARMLGADHKSIACRFKKLGLEINEPMKHKLTITNSELKTLYLKKGWTLEMIGEKYGVSRERVRQRLKKLGVSGRWNQSRINKEDWTPHDGIPRKAGKTIGSRRYGGVM